MQVFLRFFYICILLSKYGVNTEVYSSTAHLETVFEAEKEIVEKLENYIAHEQEKIDALKRYIDEFNSFQLPTDVEDVVYNPLSAYQLVKRLSIDWTPIEKIVNDDSWKDLILEVQSLLEKRVMPEEKDLQGAALAILRLQETYDLSASDLARGNIFGIQTPIGLSAKDCLYLGKVCTYQEYYDMAFEWYHLALNISTQESNSTVSSDDITPLLRKTIKNHDLILENEGNKPHIFPYPIKDRTPAEMKNLIPPPEMYVLGNDISSDDIFNNYYALCRGLRIRSFIQEAKLKCYLSTQRQPSFFINPIKVEVHSHDLPLVTFHDVIYESEINIILEASKPKLKRSTTGVKKAKISSIRTSMNTWLVDEDDEDEKLHQTLKSIMNRMSLITGLNVYGRDNAESLQVANYGIGGHYEPHHDYSTKRDVKPERIATLMFYLSDVKSGGATVFPSIGAAILPRKGSAVFWFNLHRSGKGDKSSVHAACPVLYGSKWGNKWIADEGQVFTRPCSLNPAD